MNWWGVAANTLLGGALAAGVVVLLIRCVDLVERAEEALWRRRARRLR